MNKFGLIGQSVEHSFSKVIHEYISDITYDLVSLKEEADVLDFLKSDFKGFNVTNPYKTLMYNNCQILSDGAKATCVVNTVTKKDGKLYGDNTDIFGFEYLLSKNKIDVQNKVCLIFGTGATSRTVYYVLSRNKAKQIYFISRTPDNVNSFDYNDQKIFEKAEIIINATPYGKYPDYNVKPLFNFETAPHLECFIDVIYNPTKTTHLYEAKVNNKAKVVNGLSMLVAQALKANELFTNHKYSKNDFDNAYLYCLSKCSNIVIIGHPASGKTTIGKAIAENLKMRFIDSDEKIEKAYSESPENIILNEGVDSFRTKESTIIGKMSSLKGYVISLGGGAPTIDINMVELVKNSYVVNLERDIKSIDGAQLSSRPLSNDIKSLEKIITERKEIYERYADITVSNNDSVSLVVDKIRSLL